VISRTRPSHGRDRLSHLISRPGTEIGAAINKQQKGKAAGTTAPGNAFWGEMLMTTTVASSLFYVYNTLAPILAAQFFSGVDPSAAFIFTLLSFAAGFAVRPVWRFVRRLPALAISSAANTPSSDDPDGHRHVLHRSPAVSCNSRHHRAHHSDRLASGAGSRAPGGEYGGAATYVAVPCAEKQNAASTRRAFRPPPRLACSWRRCSSSACAGAGAFRSCLSIVNYSNERAPEARKRACGSVIRRDFAEAHQARLSGEHQPGRDQPRHDCDPATVLVIYLTLIYAPIAGWLVELFPTRIRYSGMSLPHHIGNGWFGGFLPAPVFAIGNIYSGLWSPIVVAAKSFAVGLIFLPERKDRDISQN
jgi:hypothetical protein